MSTAASQAPATPQAEPVTQQGPAKPLGHEHFLRKLKQEKQPEPEPEALEAGKGVEGKGQPEEEAPSDSAAPAAILENEDLAEEEPEEAETEASAEEDAEEEPEEAEADGAEVGEIEVDGEKVSMETIREWKLGAMRQADYTRKTQAVAEQRKALESEINSVSEFAGFYDTLAESFVQGFDQVNWNQLRVEQPEKYQQLRQALSVRQNEAEFVRQKAEAFKSHITQAKEQIRNEQIEMARQALPNMIPGWGEETYSKILDFAVRERGYSQEEAAEIIDPRRIRDLYDSMRLHAASQKVKQPANQKPKPRPKPGVQPAQQRPDIRPDGKMRAAYARLQKNPQDRKLQVAYHAEKLKYERGQKG